MAQNDELWTLLLGGFAGYMLATSKPEDKKELQEYRDFKQQLQIRQHKIGVLPSLQAVMAKPTIYTTYIEATKMFMFGFFRGSAILCSAIIETLLTEKFGEGKFVDLITKAKEAQVITDADAYYLHGLRLERNDFVHNVLREVTEEDALLILKITNKIIDKIVRT